jgi:hypothetical protein
MTNYGRATTSGNDTWQENQGSQNQQGYYVAGVPKGSLMAINLYAAGGLGGTCRTATCLWNSSGTLLVASGTLTLAAGGSGINAQAWHRFQFGGTTGFPIADGNYYIGFWRNSGDAIEWSYNNGTGGPCRPQINSSVGNVGSPSNLSIGTGTTASMSLYLEWQPGGIFGADTGGTPLTIQEVYGNHTGGLAPVAVPGVYRGPAGGGSPVQIW